VVKGFSRSAKGARKAKDAAPVVLCGFLVLFASIRVNSRLGRLSRI
jgi:hypothetical protein